MYTGGVLSGAACGINMDHGVLVVGYGTENDINYYLVQNTWGANWGERGYIKIAVEEGKGVCGIQQDAGYPTLK